MKIYCISGLAADHAMFQRLEFPAGYNMIPLPWIPPEKNEQLPQYALRLAKKIDTTEPFGIMGLSMGGMMATEISKAMQPALTILISSIPISSQLPWYYRWLGYLRLHQMVPVSLFRRAALLKRIFTFESKEDKILLRNMIRRADPKFIHWAMGAILSWKNSQIPGSYLHFHGTRDELLPIRFVHPTHVIKGGTHLMILDHAAAINRILAEELKA